MRTCVRVCVCVCVCLCILINHSFLSLELKSLELHHTIYHKAPSAMFKMGWYTTAIISTDIYVSVMLWRAQHKNIEEQAFFVAGAGSFAECGISGISIANHCWLRLINFAQSRLSLL